MDIRGNRDSSDNPCVGRCSTHLGDDICKGCGRTCEQVMKWPEYTKEQRIEINNKLKRNEHEK